MNKILDRIEKLLRLTESPEIEEERNAALAVCRLIREHKLKVVAGNAEAPKSAPPITGTWDGRVHASQVDAQGHIRYPTAGKRTNFDPTSGKTKKAKPAKSGEAEPRYGWDEMPVRPVHMQAKFPGNCKACNAFYEEGAEVIWVKGKGCVCADDESCHIPPFDG